MSTKIFHGYRLAEGTDIWEFTERLRRDGNVLRDELDMEVIERFSEGVVNERRQKDQELPKTDEARLMLGYHGWHELMIELKDARIGDPHQLEVCFIKDPGTGRIMALLYAGSKMEAFWESQPEVEPWGYWNNTDQPEGVTEEEWEERRQAWERCLPNWSPPARQALTFQLRCDPTDGIIEMIYRDES